MRHIVIGDVHGCIDELQEMIKLAHPDKGDSVVLLGDLIDRGPDPAGVVQYAMESGFSCVMGNHEEKALRWRKHESRKTGDPKYKNPMRAVHKERIAQWMSISDKAWDWIAGRPTYLRFHKDWVALHAGLLPNVPIERQTDNHLIRMRYISKTTGKMIPVGGPDDPPDSVLWADLWTGPEKVVYGHITFDNARLSPHWLASGLDTGCCHGNKLTALVVEDGRPTELLSVAAKKEYSPRKSSWGEDDETPTAPQ